MLDIQDQAHFARKRCCQLRSFGVHQTTTYRLWQLLGVKLVIGVNGTGKGLRRTVVKNDINESCFPGANAGFNQHPLCGFDIVHPLGCGDGWQQQAQGIAIEAEVN